MPNPQLTKDQLTQANDLLSEVRAKLQVLSDGDAELLFAFRRKIAKELTYDERGKPMHRVRLKKAKLLEQNGRCAICDSPLPLSHNVLDRIAAIGGYTADNTRLICQPCDIAVQRQRSFA